MKRTFKIFGAGVLLTIPIAIVSSCGIQSSADIQVDKNQGIFLPNNIQENKKRAHILMPEIVRQKIKTYNPDLSASYGVPLISGGFGEVRHFYSSKNNLSIHMGDDVFVKANTEILAPYDGEVIASWGKSMQGELGNGLGTQVIMKVPIENMNLSKEANEKLKGEKFVFLAFGHLSYKTPSLLPGKVDKKTHFEYRGNFYNWVFNTSITPENPLKVKKGQKIGEVGNTKENGGWVPHVHVEVYKGSSTRFKESRIKGYKPEMGWTDQEFKTKQFMFWKVKAAGVYMLSGKPNKDKLLATFWGGDYTHEITGGININKHIAHEHSKQFRDGIIDPNLIYKLWNKDSKVFTMK